MPPSHRLYILRHAKSSWDAGARARSDLADHDRPLAPRGRREAELMAGHIRGEGVGPSVILCSTARRARETLAAVAPAGETSIEPELYGASVGVLIRRLRRVPRGTDSVMVIGHNPSLHDLVATLAPRQEVAKFPAGALATLTFACPWSGLGPGKAELSGFVRPRDLA